MNALYYIFGFSPSHDISYWMNVKHVTWVGKKLFLPKIIKVASVYPEISSRQRFVIFVTATYYDGISKFNFVQFTDLHLHGGLKKFPGLFSSKDLGTCCCCWQWKCAFIVLVLLKKCKWITSWWTYYLQNITFFFQ